MRTTTKTLIAAVTLVTLTGCAGTSDEAASPTADPTTAQPSTAPPSTATPTPTSPAQTAVPAEVMLPEGAFVNVTGAVQQTEGVAPWSLPESCLVGAPDTATAMRQVTFGDGAEEGQIGMDQVAVFADADAAVAEMDRIAAAVESCSATPGTESTYRVEPVEIGAQGIGLVNDYYGTGDDSAMGTYTVVTRRGNAVRLVGIVGGESLVGETRAHVTPAAQQGWELLCGYDTSGC